MKRYLLFIIIGATLLWNTSSHALGELGASGGSNTNPHNLSVNNTTINAVKASTSQTYPGKETQICIFCHAPHSATPQTTLWNRPDPTGPVGGFQLRVGTTLNIDDVGFVSDTHYATSAAEGYPNGTSKLCLSCHDGVTAIGVLAHNVSIDMTEVNLGGRASEIDLTTSHPISFIYNATIAGNLGASYKFPAAGSGYLEIDSGGITRVQCTSCHQPHQDTMATNSLPFWRDMTATQETAYDNVCGACHTTNYSATGFDDHNY